MTNANLNPIDSRDFDSEAYEERIGTEGIRKALEQTLDPSKLMNEHNLAFLKPYTMDELDNFELFGMDFLVQGGPMRSCIARSNGKNYWMEIGSNEEYSSQEFRDCLEEVFENPILYMICVSGVFE